MGLMNVACSRVQGSHPENPSFVLKLTNPNSPNGRPINASHLLSWEDILALAAVVDRMVAGDASAAARAALSGTHPHSSVGESR